MEVVQNKVVRFIMGRNPRTRITCDILDKVNMLCVKDRVSQLRLSHVFSI